MCYEKTEREIKKMKRKVLLVMFLVLAMVLTAVNVAGPVSADAATLYVDDDNVCGDNSPCYLHPQDAVNAANPGDTIMVYPGTYDSRYFVCDLDHPTWCAPNDNWAPALIVYKDGLTIRAVDPNPATTIIQSTHNFWSNAIAVQNSTAGAIVGVSSWSPNAITVVANNVTIEGFTLHRPFEGTWATYNTAGVFIGSKASGYPDYLGQANGATVQNCVFSNLWHAVYIWHSSGNTIVNNTVAALTTNHWAAISTYDGDSDASIGYGNLSEDNLIADNTIANKGISLGAWAPTIWTSNAGSAVCSNTTTDVGVSYAHGPVIIGCNTGGFWQSNTDNVLRITGIAYTGDTGVFPVGTAINLSALLAYDGSADGSGVDVIFTIDDEYYAAATTVAGGAASTTANLAAGVYEVQATVTVCGDCVFTSDAQFVVVYDPSAGFVTGGGWIMSPEGAYPADPSLEGKATFGFVSKYKKGASVPEGNTEFQFKAGDLNFHSASYDWLVVTGSNYARYKGTGTINGAGEYKFMIWAGDGTGDDGADTFRIKIWWEEGDTEHVVYDNGMDQAIGGGNIAVHTKK
jgi:parallel beta-helix repeat protein